MEREWLRCRLEVQGDASVGGEAVEDGHRERGDACLWGVAGRVVEGDQAVGVTGDQHQVTARQTGAVPLAALRTWVDTALSAG